MVIAGISPSKAIRLLLPSFITWVISAEKYHQLVSISYNLFFHKIHITEVISVVVNILNCKHMTVSLKSTLQKRFFLSVMLKGRFNTRFLRNILLSLLEERNCSLSSLYLGCNKEAIKLYPYFVCKCIELFLLKSYACCEIFCTNHCFLKLGMLPIIGNHSDIRK